MKFLKSLGALFVKYFSLVFLLIAVVLLFTWVLPTGGKHSSSWVASILVLIAVLIMSISHRNKGKWFTNESGGH